MAIERPQKATSKTVLISFPFFLFHHEGHVSTAGREGKGRGLVSCRGVNPLSRIACQDGA